MTTAPTRSELSSDALGRATLLATLEHYSPGRTHDGRQCSQAQVPERAALAIEEFGLTNATTWNTSSGTIKHAVSILAKAGPTAGFADWATTYDIGHSYNNIATALRIPKDLHTGLYSDSLLYMYNEGMRTRKAVSAIYLWSEQSPGYWMNQASCIGGHTPTQTFASWPTEPELIAKEDTAK